MIKKCLLSAALLLAPLVASADIAISTITPAGGLTRGGEFVHVHGSNLLQRIACVLPCPTTVKFGGTPGTIVGVTVSEIVVLAPPHSAGSVDVDVDVPGAGAATIASGYFYQEPQVDDRVRLLIPVAISAPGASNTNWQTDVLVNNGNGEALVLENAAGPGGDVAHGVTPATIPPFSTSPITLSPPPGNTGVFVYVPRRLVDNVLVSVRVHDTSRDGDSWGAEIPVVPEGQFRRSVLLVGIPNDARFRTLLRVYGYGFANDQVKVSLRDDVTGELLDTRMLELISGTQDGTNPPVAPAYGQLSLEGILAPFASLHRQVRVEIAPTGFVDTPMWGFVAITNNITQQVTTISPAIVPTAVAIPTPPALALGHWGSPDACLDVTATQVTTTFHCDGGSFPTPLVGSDGRFEVDGTFESLFPLPGPIVSAHYSGVLQGTSLTIAVRVGTTTVPGISVQFGFPSPCNSASFCPISDDPLGKPH
jgi:IPT/TIG domain